MISWCLGAADERVKVVVPVCQTGSIEHVVVDRATDGHCDCAFWINYYRWCWPDLGALIAPRALLIASGSEDVLWRPYGYRDVAHRIRHQYAALGAAEPVRPGRRPHAARLYAQAAPGHLHLVQQASQRRPHAGQGRRYRLRGAGGEPARVRRQAAEGRPDAAHRHPVGEAGGAAAGHQPGRVARAPGGVDPALARTHLPLHSAASKTRGCGIAARTAARRAEPPLPPTCSIPATG